MICSYVPVDHPDRHHPRGQQERRKNSLLCYDRLERGHKRKQE